MFEAYSRGLARPAEAPHSGCRHRLRPLAVTLIVFWPIMRRDFYPEVDGGAFEMYARAPSGTRIERTVEKVAQLEEFIKKTIPEHDLELFVSEIGVNADWSAAYTPNAGPDGRGHQGPAQGASDASRPRNTSTSSVPGWPRTRGSRTWISASTPADWSAVP